MDVGVIGNKWWGKLAGHHVLKNLAISLVKNILGNNSRTRILNQT